MMGLLGVLIFMHFVMMVLIFESFQVLISEIILIFISKLRNRT